MKKKVLAAMLLSFVAIAVWMAPPAALAQADNAHIKETVTHSNEAVKHGKMGHADVATAGAEEAVKHLAMMK